MFAIHRPHLAGLIASIGLAAAGAASNAGSVFADSLPASSCADIAGGSSTTPATVTDLRVAHHSGYDRLVVEFGNSSAVPQYRLSRQTSSTFSRDASGQAVTLEGAAGIRLVLQNTDVSASAPAVYSPRLPEIRQVFNIGDFERVVSYGVGLREGACARAFELSGPSRLVVDVATAGDSATPAAAAPSSAAASEMTPAPSAAADAAGTQELATTGHPFSQPAPSSPLIALVAGLLLLVGGSAIAAVRRVSRS